MDSEAQNIDRAREHIPKAIELHAKYPLFDGHNGECVGSLVLDHSKSKKKKKEIVLVATF